MSKIHTYLIVITIISGILVSGCGDGTKQPKDLLSALPPSSGLNVLVISFDALRADALSLHGYHLPTSPRLDAFAQEAVVFENAYVAAPVTPTSFASAFTGQYPYKVFVGWQLLPATTLADVMSEAGYRTFALLNNRQLVAERHFDQGWQVFETGPWLDEEELVERTRELIDDSAASSEPWLGWVHFISPHGPYQYRELSAHIAPAIQEGRFAQSSGGGEFEVENEQELARLRELYDGEVFYADYLFGQVIDHLEAVGELESTIVVVTSDHGEEFMEHGQLQHNATYEEIVRVPMIIRHPAVKTGSRSDVPFLNTDLMPTLLSMMNMDIPGAVDGIDLRTPVAADRHRIVTAMTNPERYELLSEAGGFKLMQICTPEYREELYDLNTDPGEKSNILLDRPDVANELDAALRRSMGAEPCALIRHASSGKAPEDLLTPEQIEELKSLGYIQ